MFNVGDVVQLKSGGISMTVADSSNVGVQCSWFTANGALKSVRFDPEMLREAEIPTTLEQLVCGLGDKSERP